ncbi:membrane dipeptidase [Thalassotalea psychrophila]|uniref:Membrane dipeptidase n=1 Tax=Thalassotalea psychrophila TaxID=3065647 RepID=A0ABY9TZG5_9GAMM|nr:membrane dipeptidase [Colwelliaceae bacterium SQ149]
MNKSILALTVAAVFSAGAMAAKIELTDDVHGKYYNSYGKTDAQITERIKFLVDVSNPRTEEDRAKDNATIKRYKDAIVINTLHVTTAGFAGADEASYEQALWNSYEHNITLESATVSNGDAKLVGASPVDNAIRAKAVVDSLDHTMHVDSVEDIYSAKKNEQLGVVYNIQGSDFIDPLTMEDQVIEMKNAGILTANFAYNVDNHLATGGNKSRTEADKGLTNTGKALVKMYNKHNIIVDCSHSSDKTCLDAAKITTLPMIASHSNAQGVHDVSRNISDEAIIAIAKTGGTISPTFLGPFMNDEGTASSEDIAIAINYVATVISENTDLDGRKHVGFAADFTHTLADAFEVIVRSPERYPPESGYATPAEQAFASDIWGAVPVLEQKYGWSEQDIRGVLGENVLRVYKQVWSKS